MSEMNLRQIMQTAGSVENNLTNLAAVDGNVGRQFSTSQMDMAQKFKSDIDDSISLAKEQQYDSTVSTIVTGALSAVAAVGLGSGLAFPGSTAAAVGSTGSTIQQLAGNVAAPAVQGGVGIAKTKLIEKQGENQKDQMETSAAMKMAGNIASNSIDQASSLVEDRSKEESDLLAAIKNQNGASNY